ncbi:G patch domain-containing protein 11 [Platysternon megacephalum]|uniref:Solute carrier family 12 member 9 n=1 Tax=Platysternon megacephalum TaxID=55544 RepID=A0A4D9DRE8_9SAUR|nr:G patch domain-containing protein 11 [Platysternon megacephalum]
MTSFTCERTLLKEDYGFFRSINLWPPLVLVGVYAASLSASMSSLIGASRILHALAKDDLFGIVLAPAKIVSKGGNPWVAVLYTWALVQLFSWHTCLLGIASCLLMMFLISPAGASGSLVLMLALLGFIHLRAPASSWGYISQALIFHQVPGREPRRPGSHPPCSEPPAPAPLPAPGREPRRPGSQPPLL